jgi:predicted O-linked N-acetylglucosamine transferase (SPINDLY family)
VNPANPHSAVGDPDDILVSAASNHQAGRLDAAERLYNRVLQEQPQNPIANHNLAVLAMQSGRGLRVALPLFGVAWRADPSHQQHWISYLKALVHAGDLKTAAAVHADGTSRGLQGPSLDTLAAMLKGQRAAPAQMPTMGEPAAQAPFSADQESLFRLLTEKRFAEAEQLARGAIDRFPTHGLGWKVLGIALRELGRLNDAVAPLVRATALAPDDPEVFNNLGRALLDLGMLNEAERAFGRAVAIRPDYPAHLGLALVQLRLHRLVDAEQSCDRAMQLRPDLADANYVMGGIRIEQGRAEEAKASYYRALALRPDYVAAYDALGKMLHDENRISEAEALCHRFLTDVPDNFYGHVALGQILSQQGRLGEAAAAYEQALCLRPDSLGVRSEWLFLCNYLSNQPPERLYEEAVRFGHWATKQAIAPFKTWACESSPTRLKVGIVSGDLRDHPVGYFLETMLAHVNKSRIEWIAYPTNARSDELTARLRHSLSAGHSLVGLTDLVAAEQIRKDGIHVLLDLSGHTAFGRLPVFAWRPAPVQASWLGYFATTGLAEMDYLIADAVGVPARDRAHFTEKIWYMPETRLCFTPPSVTLTPAALPALRNGQITFGCFQKLPKINDHVLSVWAGILDSCQTARLRVQTRAFGDPAIAAGFAERLRASNIDPGRVTLIGRMSREQYLAAYGEVDILLDTFPYPGGTTTCEALWMGVPTVTLAGETLLARQGASLMTAAGLSDWIANSPAGYVRLALDRAADPDHLAALRAEMRAQVAGSPLFDGPRFARHLEDALWAMWAARQTSGECSSAPADRVP